MTAKEWLGVMQQAENYNPAMTPLIIKYGEMLLDEQPIPVNQVLANTIWEHACKVTLYEAGKIVGNKIFDASDELNRAWEKLGEAVSQMPIPEIPEKYLSSPSPTPGLREKDYFLTDKISLWLEEKSKHKKVGERYTYLEVVDLIAEYVLPENNKNEMELWEEFKRYWYDDRMTMAEIKEKFSISRKKETPPPPEPILKSISKDA